MKYFPYLADQRFLKQGGGIIITASSIAILLIILRLAGWLQLLEWAALDRFFSLRPPEPPDSRITIVGVSEADIQQLGKWPMSDAVLAELITKIKQKKPIAIGLDIYRDLPVEPGHQNLVKVFQTTPNLIGIKKVSTDSDFGINPPPELKKRQQVAASDLVLDADNKVRRGLLYIQSKDGKIVPSLGLRMALIYLETKGVEPQNATNSEYLQLGKTVFIRLRANDGGYVRTYDRGYQIFMNFKNPRLLFKVVSLTDVLENKVKDDLFRDRLVFIGVIAPSLKDLFQTSYDGGLLDSPQLTSGVEIHANLTSQIISAALENRPLLQVWSEPLEWLWILFWSGFGATLTWQWRYANITKKLLVWKVAILILAGGGLVSSTYIAFLWGWWIPVVPPLLAFAGSTIVGIAYIAYSAGVIRQIFGRYLSDAVVPTLLETPRGLAMGGERRKVTILVSDLRGFTAISERLSPEEAVKILNIYLAEMTDIITSYQGSIDDFIGDGIMVIFGIPTPKEDDAKRAVACALAMQLAMESINSKISNLGSHLQLEMGIGINTGDVLLGNIGSKKRTKYTAIGSEVNLAFRIETYTKGGDIFISDSTLKEVDPIVSINSQMEVKPKGVKQPITIYEVSGICGEYNLFAPKKLEIFLILPQEIPLQYSILEGKHISDTFYTGCIAQLSAKQALVRSDDREGYEAALSIKNIKINLTIPSKSNPLGEDIYAKILDKSAESGSFYIAFTSVPPDIKVYLNTIYKSI